MLTLFVFRLILRGAFAFGTQAPAGKGRNTDVEKEFQQISSPEEGKFVGAYVIRQFSVFRIGRVSAYLYGIMDAARRIIRVL